MKETKGLVTQKGNPIVLVGSPIRVGQKAPDFDLVTADGKQMRLADSRGKVRLVSVVYSLDTSVCDLQTQKFEEEAPKFKDVVFYTISMDLPTAQARYSKAHENKNVQLLSDHREAAFGADYGLLIKGQRMLSRAVLIIDEDDIVRYVEYVKEVGQLPDFDKAFEALKEVTTRQPGIAPMSRG